MVSPDYGVPRLRSPDYAITPLISRRLRPKCLVPTIGTSAGVSRKRPPNGGRPPSLVRWRASQLPRGISTARAVGACLIRIPCHFTDSRSSAKTIRGTSASLRKIVLPSGWCVSSRFFTPTQPHASNVPIASVGRLRQTRSAHLHLLKRR